MLPLVSWIETYLLPVPPLQQTLALLVWWLDGWVGPGACWPLVLARATRSLLRCGLQGGHCGERIYVGAQQQQRPHNASSWSEHLSTADEAEVWLCSRRCTSSPSPWLLHSGELWHFGRVVQTAHRGIWDHPTALSDESRKIRHVQLDISLDYSQLHYNPGCSHHCKSQDSHRSLPDVSC